MSDFHFTKLTDYPLSNPPKKKLLLDSNIWIKVIAPSIKPSNKDKAYQDFFYKLIECKGKNIVLPALVVSEVMNRLLRDVYMQKFKKNKGVQGMQDSSFYKEHFRPSTEYRAGCMLIADEFKTYLEKLELKNDEFGQGIKYKHVLSKFDFDLDFNDSYFYFLAKNNNYCIVTDDADFCVKGVEVLTLNENLLKKNS